MSASLFIKIGLMVAICSISLDFSYAKAKKPVQPTWQTLARSVGMAEDNRAAAIQALKKIPDLKSKLKRALYTSHKPLALDVMSALEMKDLVPDLLFHVRGDLDGFLTLALNSMVDEKNRASIVDTYLENLSVENLDQVTDPTLVAMLEPLGRLGIRIPEASLDRLVLHPSPDVRSAMLYYFRITILRHNVKDHVPKILPLQSSQEFQLRLQAISVLSEIHKAKIEHDGLPSRGDLKDSCEKEKTSQVKKACLQFVAGAGE